MNIELTDKEFRRLLDLVYIGNWILNSTREKDRFEDYDILQEKLFALCAKNGMNALISRWQGHIFPSPAYENGGIHEAIADYEDAVFFDILAEELARREGAGALVTGESLGQVASQTLDNIRATNDAVELPVLRPLIGSDKLEIIEAAQELGTFEISSMDAPDCCTLFMPRNPETHAKLEAVREAEAAFPVDEWVRALADAAEPHDYACPAYKPPKKRE